MPLSRLRRVSASMWACMRPIRKSSSILGGTPGVYAHSCTKVVQHVTLPLLLPGNNKRSRIKYKERPLLVSHDKILFSFHQVGASAARSSLEFDDVSLYEVCFSFLNYLLQYYLIRDPGLFSQLALVQQDHFAYDSYERQRLRILR